MNELFDAAEELIINFRGELRDLRGNFIEEILRKELLSGTWGAAAKEIFQSLTPAEQKSILHALKLQELSAGRSLEFLAAVKGLFPDSEIYFYKRFLRWLPEEDSATARRKIKLIKILFMEVGNTELEIFFGAHFGVFGSPRTMQLDEMILY